MERRINTWLAPILFLIFAFTTYLAGQVNPAVEVAKKGWQAFHEGRLDDAKSLLAEAVRLNPKQPRYQAALGEVNWSLRDAQGASRHFEIALKLDPSNTSVRYRLVQIYQASGQDLDVVRVLQVRDPPEPLCSIWRFSRAYSLFRLGRLVPARHEFLALVNHPDFEAPANFFLGRIAFAQNHFQEALPFFSKAVRVGDSPTNKEFSSYTYDYGLTLFRLGRYAEANAEFTLSTQRHSSEPLTWMMRGRCDEELKNYKAAIDNYEESIRIDPKFELSYYHLARLQQRYGDKRRADELFKHLEELRNGELKDAQIRAEEAAMLKMKSGPASDSPPPAPTHSTSNSAP